MAANGGFSRNVRIKRIGFITRNHCQVIWRNSEMSYFENIKEDGLPTKMSLGPIKN